MPPIMGLRHDRIIGAMKDAVMCDQGDAQD
jgi:hypothetical protein